MSAIAEWERQLRNRAEAAERGMDGLGEQLLAAQSELTRLRAALATAERERDEAREALAVEARQGASVDRLLLGLQSQRDNATALAVARGRALHKAREMFINIKDKIADEGDRVYFGSTNDADRFKECVDDLDAWEWDAIMEEGKIPDVYEISRKAHEQSRAAESRASSAEALLAEAGKLLKPLVTTLRGHSYTHKHVCLDLPEELPQQARALLAKIKEPS
jgi:hypothetical protein